ncbi:hypothetical protein BWI96_05145 [Siphonobacter sp. SORGH_AS_0500]|uniref:hypothetical protein n=1 Tax=Siphonobacter sp. SORGH_AS_0500 TaxID=1864824 RepID=UPI000CBBC28C|nr:hypothetical protein [Siphonobacter sp. SORGH_AS_0500]PKK37847.1 hypothetical protein BWI96_05145 [Siphonobacter sp. SORGH_AS_0500]
MEDNQKEFLLKEYDKLNNEVSKLLEETRTREKYSLTVIAVIAAWIFTEIIKFPKDVNISRNNLIPLLKILSWIPVVITFLYGISVLLIYKNIKWIGEYLFEIEKKFIDGLEYKKDKVFGWENYFNDKNRKSYFVNWSWVFWILQIAISVAIIIKTYYTSA